jgi:hypothetical protein
VVKKKSPARTMKVTPSETKAPVNVIPVMVEEVKDIYITPDGELEVTETIITVDDDDVVGTGFEEDDIAEADDEKEEDEPGV